SRPPRTSSVTAPPAPPRLSPTCSEISSGVVPRAFVIVIDACGAGELPDSADYGDAGANTLGHVAEAIGGLDLPVLTSLGLGNIMPLKGATPVGHPVVHGRLHPLGPGKDTITGHWELMGVITPVPLRTYPDGF